MNNNEESLPILESEVRNAILTLKNGKSPCPDNIPGELLKHGGESLIKIFTTICQEIWKTKKWPDQWTKSLIIPIPKKGDSRKCSNYRTLSHIPHASKILLRIILNRLNPQAETILAEEQAGFRISGRKISNLSFADDIDLIAGSNTELQDLTNRLVESSKAHGMEISQEKSKTMVNSKNNDKCAKIYMGGILLKDVKIFKYLGATLKSD